MSLPGDEIMRLPAPHAGPKGFAPYTPRPGTKNHRIVTAALEVVEIYREQDRLPLGSREVGYLLTGDRYGFTHDDIKAVEQAVERMRRARIIDMDAISDGRTSSRGPWRVHGPEPVVVSALEELTRAQLDRQAGQTYRVEVWAEAAGWIDRLEPMCAERGVEVYSGSGSVPLLAVVGCAVRVIRASAHGQRTVILHIGDLDLNGLRNIARPFEADVLKMVADMGGLEDVVEVRRLLLTPDQVEVHIGERALNRNLTAEHRKAGWPLPYTVQAEALPPEIRDEIVEDALDELLDADIRADVITAEEALHAEARELLRDRLNEGDR